MADNNSQKAINHHENVEHHSFNLKFWQEVATEFKWKKEGDIVSQGNFSSGVVKWFLDGKLNITENCLDRHLETRGNKLAIVWEPNDPREKFVRLTYKELFHFVGRFANVLKKNGVSKGDRVCIYMPMIPEVVFAVLACARLGAVHVVIFSDFSAHAIAERIKDSSASLVITTDGLNRGAKQIPLKRIIDEALEDCDSVKKVIVIERLGWAVNMEDDRDVWFEDEVKKVNSNCDPEYINAEDYLFILYTSGATGKPAGIVHSCGGYMVQTGYTFKKVFNIRENDIFYCTADIGWITGHSLLIYGPLLNGATIVMYEGIPSYPDTSRICEIIDKHNVTIFYTSPTIIRTIKTTEIDDIVSYSMKSLRLLGIVGEPIDEETWHWFNIHIGKEKCPIIDTWLQTETGTILITPKPDKVVRPGYSGEAMPGIDLALLDAQGDEISRYDTEGFLYIKNPWPSAARGIWGDQERYHVTYFSKKNGYYFTGDGAIYDSDNRIKITGRVDDVINILGQRYSYLEIEKAINQQPHVVESAVVGYLHPIKGQGIYAFIVCQDIESSSVCVEDEIIEQVSLRIGKSVIPDKIQFVRELPKTASGKVLRPILSQIANGRFENLQDAAILLNPDIIMDIIKGAKKIL